MKFASPEIFKWLLLLLPLAAAMIVLHRQRAGRLTRLIASSTWSTVIPGYNPKQNRRRTILRLLALLCIGLALTRPQWGFKWEEVQQRGLDIVVVLDTSKSMLAADVKPYRLQQAQWAVRDFVRHLKGDRIGLVAFAGSSFLQCPVTIDYAAFTMMLDDLYAGIIPRGGTAIAQALDTAIESFDDESQADRVVILITDGEDHDGDPLGMVEKLKAKNIRLYSIGVGTTDGELVPVGNGQGYMKDEKGRVVKSSLNESLLEKLAAETGGFYVRSAPGDFGLDRIYKLGIAGLQRDEQETRLAKVYEERFGWFAAAALLFLLIEGLPRRLKASGAKALALLLLCSPRAEAGRFEKAYKRGDYTNALQSLEAVAEKHPALAAYNEGCVRYRQNHFDEAEQAFAEAAAQTEDRELKQRAFYNRGTALFRKAHLEAQNPEEIESAFESAEQAVTLFEQALELKPEDTDAKKNLERSVNLIVTGRVKSARQLVDAADRMLTEFQAKTAKENYLAAKKLLEPVLDDFSPESGEAEELRDRAEKQLQMLEKAVAETRDDMAAAQAAIDGYAYKMAADIMLEDKPARHLAFDLDETLAQEFQQLVQNNMNVIKIIYPENPLKP